MYNYNYPNILTCPNLENLHSDILNTFPDKEFTGCRYDQCCHNCNPCVHLDIHGFPFNSIDIKFCVELSTSEKTSLDSIVEKNI